MLVLMILRLGVLGAKLGVRYLGWVSLWSHSDENAIPLVIKSNVCRFPHKEPTDNGENMNDCKHAIVECNADSSGN